MTSVKIQKILVPVEFDAVSRRALAYAVGIGEAFGAHVHALHAIESAQPALAPAPLTSPLGSLAALEAAKRDAEALQQRLVEMVAQVAGEAKVEVSTEVVQRPLSELLRDTELGYDLVVMGTHDHSWLERLFHASHTKSAISETSRPILVVPGPRGEEASEEAGGV